MSDNKELMTCWYCGELIHPEVDLVYTDNDGKQEPTHLGCSLELGISFTTDDGFDNDIIEEVKNKIPDLDYYEILEGLRDGSIDLDELNEDEQEENEDDN